MNYLLTESLQLSSLSKSKKYQERSTRDRVLNFCYLTHSLARTLARSLARPPARTLTRSLALSFVPSGLAPSVQSIHLGAAVVVAIAVAVAMLVGCEWTEEGLRAAADAAARHKTHNRLLPLPLCAFFRVDDQPMSPYHRSDIKSCTLSSFVSPPLYRPPPLHSLTYFCGLAA